MDIMDIDNQEENESALCMANILFGNIDKDNKLQGNLFDDVS